MEQNDRSGFEKLKKKFIVFAVISLSVLIVSFMLYGFAGNYFKNKSYDFLIKYVGGRESKPHDDVILLLIDENSLKYGERINLGRWPWPRNIYPEILSYLNASDPPKAIMFDIFFVESDLGKGHDEAFAQEIAASGNVIHNMILFKNPEKEKKLEIPPDVIDNFTIKIKDPEKISYKKNDVNEFSFPIPCLRSDFPCGISDEVLVKENETAEPLVKGLSVASFTPDNDGIYRRGRILFNYGKYYFPSFALAALKAYTGISEIEVLDNNVLQLGKYRIPVDENGNYLVNYYTKNRVPAYSMSALMLSYYYLQQGEEDKIILAPEMFKDKIVIIGCSAPGCQDLKNTPIHKTTPGPEIHANIISNILQHNEIDQEKEVITFILSAAMVLFAVMLILFINSNLYKIIGLFGFFIIYTGLNIWLFNSFNYLAPVLFVLVTGGISSGVSFIYLSMTEGAEKRKYSKILGNMIDPTIVSEALNDLDALKRGGEKEITAFFSDIASFSTISEKLSSEDLAALLNEYLSEMTIILKSKGGTLDKYIGDAVVGIFGAPIENPQNAILSARASLEMIRKLAELRNKWTQNNEYCVEAQNMRVRIGLNTGKAKVGFMGTDNLASYTMMGDTVNLAARLEAAGKDYGVSILVSDMTKKLIEDEMFLRKLDAVRVKGKSEPVLIYELIGEKNDVPINLVESAKVYEEAFELYRMKKWDEAIRLFKRSVEVRRKPDKAVDMLIDRCEVYKKEPPPENWDGVFTRTHK